MPLSAHSTPRIEVPLLGGNSVSVRGFNLDDFMALMPNHLEELSKVAALYAQHKNSVFSNKAFQEFILSIAGGFPGIISEVISIASDEPDTKNVRLSTGLQISVLSAIMKLTVEEAGGLGNLFAQLRVLGANVVAAQVELRANSQKQPISNASTGTGGNK